MESPTLVVGVVQRDRCNKTVFFFMNKNWYNLTKISQIWNVKNDNTFEGRIRNLYELEYKYSMAKNSPFSGHDKRRYNIINNLSKKLEENIDFIEKPIKSIISNWLKNHNMENPEEWAKNRYQESNPLNEYINIDLLGSVGLMYFELREDKETYLNRNISTYQLFIKMINENILTVDRFSSTRKLKENYFELMSDYFLEEIYDNLENFNNTYGFDFQSEDEADDFLSTASADDFNINIIDMIDNLGESFTDFFINNGLYKILENFIIDIYQYLIFPAWKEKWTSPETEEKYGKNIEKTISSVKYIQDLIDNAATLDDRIAAINAAINAVHQTGMLVKDYAEDYSGLDYEEVGDIYKLFKDLSDTNISQIEKWNKELRDVGFQV